MQCDVVHKIGIRVTDGDSDKPKYPLTIHWGATRFDSEPRGMWFVPNKFRVHSETKISTNDYCSLDTITEVNSDDYTLITGTKTMH